MIVLSGVPFTSSIEFVLIYQNRSRPLSLSRLPAYNVRSYGRVSVEKSLVESGAISTRDIQVLVQVQKWWELKHRMSSPEWVILASALRDDIAERGHIAGLHETGPDGTKYSEVSFYYKITVNDEAVDWTFGLVVRVLFHENAHHYHQSKGRFKQDKVSTRKEEQIMDDTADEDLKEFSRKYPELATWLQVVVPIRK